MEVIQAMETKSCSKCNKQKTLDMFQYRNDSKKHRNECKGCCKLILKTFVTNTNYKKGENRLAKRLEANITSFKKCTKCGENKPLDQYQKRTDTKVETYRNDCIVCRNAYVGEFKRTSEKTKKRQNQRAKERRESDPCYLMNSRIRSRLWNALNAVHTKKDIRLCELLGCSIPDFKLYIEGQFQPQMSWEKRNFVIDHIIPCAKFDLTKIEHQKLCFHFSNMQPLTWEDNAKKSDKILPEHMEYFQSLKL